MKFSDLLGEPEPEETPARNDESEPISVFAPVPMQDPDPPSPLEDADVTVPAVPAEPPPVNPPPESIAPAAPVVSAPPPGDVGGRSGLAELNVTAPAAPAPVVESSSVVDQLVGLDDVVDDLLPRRRGRR